ncbi:ABC transporter ATP-binding protein [Natrarchaeobius sp. A-rgal3]|uniref:ABC transporter ATP-binding protein n=1 Tax=Natrarchaeobius versutus TaxID=1679078 RepID=UPI00351059F8
MTETKVEVRDVKKHFPVDDGALSNLFGFGEDKSVKAVDGVSFDIAEGEAFGIAGESGCGKTTLAETILQLEEPTDGEITIDGRDVTEMDKGEINALRSDVQIIQQDPYQSLNPRFTVVQWVREPLDIHDIGPKGERRAVVRETLAEVGLRPPENYMDEYTSELSGGERQRVGIARAIVSDPSFVVCDEPVSMLDVSIRASILRLLDDLRTEKGISFMYISHDLSLLKHVCDRIGIMYLGRFVETGPSTQVINDPQHPYTQALVSSTPIINPDVERDRIELSGEVPDPVDLPTGCRFAPRCPEASAECREGEPRMYDVADNQRARCILHDERYDLSS